ncbi:hypothetical protein T01_14179 [Trichinella spiralis]|uniref:Uncharacterized protein n=1 Tax=Trichinella spiralis TaxID=6334 RepID=A0A0V0ZW93_TRISP|nr:hypothetical protein T01_6938 [Trichinella spiralis]KRY16907.1 hypothetical protein T01_14179 [Trichinella spiralis]
MSVIPVNTREALLIIAFHSALTNMSERSKEYTRSIGTQTLVSSYSYQHCGFLPVFLPTDVR